MPGAYYNFAITASLSTPIAGAKLWLVRVRDGIELKVWPPDGVDSWDAPYPAQHFEGVAPAIPVRAGDSFKVYVGHDEASAQELTHATISAYLVDSTGKGFTEVEAYRDLILGQEPIAYWRLGESSELDPAFDETGNEHTGEYSGSGVGKDGAIAGTVNTAIGYVGGATVMTYNGTEGAGSLTDFDVSHITVKAWVKDGSGGPKIIVSRLNQSITGGAIWDLYRTSGNVAEFRTWDPSASATGTTNISDGEWHHLVGTYDGTNLRIYVDGNLEDTQAVSPDLTGPTNVYVGCSITTFGFAGFFWDGDIDEVAIWDRVLSASEIAAQYAVGLSG